MNQLRLVVLCQHWIPSPVHGRGSCELKLIAKDSLIAMCTTCGQFELKGQEQLVIAPKPEPAEVKPAEELSRLEVSRNAAIAETKASALKYAAIEAGNALLGAASESDQKQRKAICGKCEHRQVTYQGKTDPAGFGWCGKCGCGNNPRALLEEKVKMPMTECPLKLWGQVEGTGATGATVWDTVKGVAKSVKHLLAKEDSKDKKP